MLGNEALGRSNIKPDVAHQASLKEDVKPARRLVRVGIDELGFKIALRPEVRVVLARRPDQRKRILRRVGNSGAMPARSASARGLHGALPTRVPFQ